MRDDNQGQQGDFSSECHQVDDQRRKKRPIVHPSLLLANARSLPAKMDELEVRVACLKPDLIVITESWLDSSLLDSVVYLDNYSIIRNDRNANGGGILCHISDFFIASLLKLPVRITRS